MDRSAIILAGGSSSRFGEDKGLLKIENKPLLSHVVDAVKGLVEEVVVVTRSNERVNLYGKIVPSNVRFVVDFYESKGPLIGALTGFKAAKGKYSLLLAFDAPFVSRDVASLLFDLCVGKSAAIPRWPNCQIEPLHAVYQTKLALEAAEKAIAESALDMRAMINKLHGVRYISTLVIEQLDPELRTFFNVNTPLDFRKAIMLAKHKKTRKNGRF